MASRVLVAAFALTFCQGDPVWAARALLADLFTRPPAESGAKVMSVLALEACVRQAQELDREGTAIDFEIAAIDREAAEALWLQKRINSELPALGDFDETELNEFQRRVIRHEELAKKFQSEFPQYQEKQKAYDRAVDDFERYCGGRFTQRDLEAVKAKLNLK